jgi:asparagine synthase (glutamine-hydrolysing)
VWDRSAALVDPGWFDAAEHTPEPVADPSALGSWRAHLREAAAQTRVVLSGEGPDNFLAFEWQAYLAYMIAKGHHARLVADLARHVAYHRRVPLLSTLPGMWRARRQRLADAPVYPRWLDPELEARLGLRERWLQGQAPSADAVTHPVRPIAHASYADLTAEETPRALDSENTAVAAEVRHPYFDLRLLRFALRVPAVPWCRRKYLLRRAFGALLPREVLTRDKTPLAADPAWAGMRGGLPALPPSPELSRYVDVRRVPTAAAPTLSAFRADFLAVAFAHWLRNAAVPRPALEPAIAAVIHSHTQGAPGP